MGIKQTTQQTKSDYYVRLAFLTVFGRGNQFSITLIDAVLGLGQTPPSPWTERISYLPGRNMQIEEGDGLAKEQQVVGQKHD